MGMVMKTIYTVLCSFILSSILVCAQSFVSPESVCYDTINKRYIISFAGSGTLGMQKDSLENLQVFASGLQQPKGMAIVDSVLFVADVNNVKAYSLYSREKIAQCNIADAQFLNDIAADDNGILYVSDTYANTIFRINTSTAASESFVTTPHASPNGLYWDSKAQRLYVVYFNTTAKPIQALNVQTKEFTDAYPTRYKQLDGITKGYDNNYYVSSWATDSVYCFVNGFKYNPIPYPGKFTSPADIYYDRYNNRIVIPCMNISKVVYLDGPPKNDKVIALLSPEDGAEDVGLKPLFKWQPVEGIGKYYLLVYRTDSYEFLDSTEASEYRMNTPLDGNRQYFWYLTGLKNDSLYKSASWSFKTTAGPEGVENELLKQLVVSPNPASDRVVVSNLAPGTKYDIIMTDLSGRIVDSRYGVTGTSAVLSPGTAATGVYYIIVRAGNDAFSWKVAINR